MSYQSAKGYEDASTEHVVVPTAALDERRLMNTIIEFCPIPRLDAKHAATVVRRALLDQAVPVELRGVVLADGDMRQAAVVWVKP